jgi:cold shock CspA family protein
MNTRVFISYAKEDKHFAEKLYNDLLQAGIRPWIDSMDLMPGQPWEMAIRKAIYECSYFLAILSNHSVRKKGFVQKEIRYALDIAEEYPEDKIFIIPVRIDECEPSFEGFRRLHRADLFPSYKKGLKELLWVFNYESEEKQALFKVESEQRYGAVKKLTDKGFGFISSPPIESDLFFHHQELIGVEFSQLREGDDIRTIIAASGRNKGPQTEW